MKIVFGHCLKFWKKPPQELAWVSGGQLVMLEVLTPYGQEVNDFQVDDVLEKWIGSEIQDQELHYTVLEQTETSQGTRHRTLVVFDYPLYHGDANLIHGVYPDFVQTYARLLHGLKSNESKIVTELSPLGVWRAYVIEEGQIVALTQGPRPANPEEYVASLSRWRKKELPWKSLSGEAGATGRILPLQNLKASDLPLEIVSRFDLRSQAQRNSGRLYEIGTALFRFVLWMLLLTVLGMIPWGVILYQSQQELQDLKFKQKNWIEIKNQRDQLARLSIEQAQKIRPKLEEWNASPQWDQSLSQVLSAFENRGLIQSLRYKDKLFIAEGTALSWQLSDSILGRLSHQFGSQVHFASRVQKGADTVSFEIDVRLP